MNIFRQVLNGQITPAKSQFKWTIVALSNSRYKAEVNAEALALCFVVYATLKRDNVSHYSAALARHCHYCSGHQRV